MGPISWSIAWLAFKTWCKKYWQILVGFFAGLIAVFVLMANGQNPKKIFEKKNDLRNKEAEAQRLAREAEDIALKENLEKFFAANEKAKEEYLDKLADLDAEKRSRILELLTSDTPEEDIAAGLKNFLD